MFNTKKKYFTKMLSDIERVIWDNEFARFKAITAYEQTRQQYDMAQDALNRTNEALKIGDNAEAQKDKEVIEKRVDALTQELKSIDERINGNESDEGIDRRLDGFVQLREITKKFINAHC